TKLPVGDVVRGPGDGGLEAAADLVLSLGAGLEPGDAAVDAELDALVVAGLEVQAVVVRGRSPVTTEQGLLAPEENCSRHRCASMQCQFHHERVSERARSLREKGSRQVRLVAMAKECITVESVHGIQRALVEIRAHAGLEFNAGLRDAPSLTLGLFA